MLLYVCIHIEATLSIEKYLTIVSGIDLQGMVQLGQNIAEHDDVARKCKYVKNQIKDYQDSFNAIEKVFCHIWKL